MKMAEKHTICFLPLTFLDPYGCLSTRKEHLFSPIQYHLISLASDGGEASNNLLHVHNMAVSCSQYHTEGMISFTQSINVDNNSDDDDHDYDCHIDL